MPFDWRLKGEEKGPLLKKDLEPHQGSGKTLGVEAVVWPYLQAGRAWRYLGDMTFATLQRKGLVNGEGVRDVGEGAILFVNLWGHRGAAGTHKGTWQSSRTPEDWVCSWITPLAMEAVDEKLPSCGTQVWKSLLPWVLGTVPQSSDSWRSLVSLPSKALIGPAPDFPASWSLGRLALFFVLFPISGLCKCSQVKKKKSCLLLNRVHF